MRVCMCTDMYVSVCPDGKKNPKNFCTNDAGTSWCANGLRPENEYIQHFSEAFVEFEDILAQK